MPRSPRIIIPLLVSLALHVLVLSAIYLLSTEDTPLPAPTPVRVVNLPPDVLKRLPPIQRPVTRPESYIPPPQRFGTSPDITIPKTSPTAEPSRGEHGEAASGTKRGTGPLPFLSQNDIDELARKGFPESKLRDNPLAADTEAFKFLAYDRWLFPALTKNMRFPELAATTGLQGNVYVTFVIMKDGSLGEVEIVKSSGYKILDDEVIRTIRVSVPLRPLPDEWNMDRYVVPAVGIFRINQRYMR